MKIGVVGGGQLGRMIGLAGVPLGFKFRFWDPSPTATAGAVGELFTADFNDLAAAEDFAAGLDVVTYEFENVPSATINRLSSLAPCRPGALSLATSQDRVTEKSFFQKHGIPTAPWKAINSTDDLKRAFDEFGPCIIKTRRFGYDGKGQFRIQQPQDIDLAFSLLGQHPLIAEKTISFQRELSLIAVRAVDGSMAVWPLVENEHRDGILHKTIAPAARISDEIKDEAENAIRTTMEALGHIGVLTIEFFEVDGKLLANEMAPRVHNSGHWTIEGSVCSQFENHVRAVAGLPLGSCGLRAPSAMINCIGEMPSSADITSIPGAHFHDYNKTPRAGRKVGHVTICDEIKPDQQPPFAERAATIENLCVARRHVQNA